MGASFHLRSSTEARSNGQRVTSELPRKLRGLGVALPRLIPRAKYALDSEKMPPGRLPMNIVDRRTILASGALALAGAAAPSPDARAPGRAKPMFSVPAAPSPIGRGSRGLPVRRN